MRPKRKPLDQKTLELFNELYQTGHEIRWYISCNEGQFRWNVSRLMRQDFDSEKTWYDVEARTLPQCVNLLDQAEREFDEWRRKETHEADTDPGPDPRPDR